MKIDSDKYPDLNFPDTALKPFKSVKIWYTGISLTRINLFIQEVNAQKGNTTMIQKHLS